MSIYKNISPLDHRYYVANRQLFDELSYFLSEEGRIRYILRIETELLLLYIEKYFDNQSKYVDIVKKARDAVTPEAVYKKEEISQHHINAVVACLKDHLPSELAAYVHLGATSADVLDTAYALSFRDASIKVIIPLLIELTQTLITVAEREAETTQMGRTHGQAAIPVTVGFLFAEYVSRLGQSINMLMQSVGNICGEFSGAVGGHHASSLINEDPLEFERTLLNRLGLEPAEYSTQIAPPEYLLRCLTEFNITFGIIANIADDLRNLQRSEINELHEVFTPSQVGSSTMPHKQNPWNSEHVKSLWKVFSPRILTFYMDQISEHQRDLTNSASARFVGEYLAGLGAAASRMLKIVKSIQIHGLSLKHNITLRGDRVLAEPVYIFLSLAGEENAHDIVRKISIKIEQDGGSLYEHLKKDPELWGKLVKQMKLSNITAPDAFFAHPEHYRGKTVEITQRICKNYRQRLAHISKTLQAS